jgi:hypothetical protein
MTTSALASALTFSALLTSTALAAGIDMDDPHRALGREDDVRIDAQLTRDTVSPGAPIAVTWQIQNFSTTPVAVADRVADASYDPDTRTITLAIGSEVPPAGNLPRMLLVGPGEKKVLRATATPMISAAASRGALGRAPRFVRIKVAILRNIAPFARLIERQEATPEPLPDALFDAWFESNETIVLNELPVQFSPNRSAHDIGRGADFAGE